MMTRWRMPLGLLGTLLLIPLVVLMATSAAHACSCVQAETSEHLSWADAVFTGNVVEEAAEPDAGDPEAMRREPEGRPMPGGAVRFTVAVDWVYKGEVPAEVELHTSSGSASCGVDPLPDEEERWLWFVAADDEGGYAAYLCGGSGPAAQTTVAEVVAITGVGAAPDSEAAEDASGDAQKGAAKRTDAEASDADEEAAGHGEGGETSAAPWAVGGLLLVVAAGLVGSGLVRRRE